MAQGTIISWSPANWITVVLMVFLAYVIVAAGWKVILQRKGMGTAMASAPVFNSPGPYGSDSGTYGVSGGGGK